MNRVVYKIVDIEGEEMNKHLIVIGIVVLLLVVGLSGCTEPGGVTLDDCEIKLETVEVDPYFEGNPFMTVSFRIENPTDRPANITYLKFTLYYKSERVIEDYIWKVFQIGQARYGEVFIIPENDPYKDGTLETWNMSLEQYGSELCTDFIEIPAWILSDDLWYDLYYGIPISWEVSGVAMIVGDGIYNVNFADSYYMD